MTQALIVDYGGVLTSKLSDTLDEWCRVDGLDRVLVDQVVASMYRESDSIVHALEMGTISPDDFSREFVERVVAAGGTRFEPAGMLSRMFQGFTEDVSMTGAVLATRAAGFKTALLSNSWGNEYPRTSWAALFDVTVISGEVGMRKPDPAIFLHTAELLGVDPAECVFVDDLAHNVRGAVAVGMVGVHHTATASTLMELEALFGVSFGS